MLPSQWCLTSNSQFPACMQGALAQVRKCKSKLKPCLLRTLQQAPDTSRLRQVAYVKTPRDLQEAFDTGKRHIEIREHLDLTTIETFATPFLRNRWLNGLNVTSNTFSIRVRPRVPGNLRKSTVWRSNKNVTRICLYLLINFTILTPRCDLHLLT
jgi:hypothetical protein